MSQTDQSAKPKRKLPTWALAALVLVSIGLKFAKNEHKQEVRQQQQQAEQLSTTKK